MHQRATRTRVSARGSDALRHALIVHRHRLFADALTQVLERIGLLVTVTSPRAAHQVASDVSPDIALIEVEDHPSSAFSIARAIGDRSPQTSLIAVMAKAGPRLVREGRAAGFHAFVTQDMALDELLDVLETALGGTRSVREAPVDPTGVARSPSFGRTSDPPVIAAQLTDREWDVLEMLIEGASGAQIADRLGLRANTVRSHVQSILTKLQVHSRLEAAGFAVRNGLVRPSSRSAGRDLFETPVTTLRSST